MARMAMTATEELDLTDAAIQECLLAQHYALPGGRIKSMAGYSALTKRRDQLLGQISEASASSGSMCSVGSIMDPYE